MPVVSTVLILLLINSFDLKTNFQVVKIVGEHLQGKTTLTPVNPPPNTKLKDIANMLNKRQGEMKLKPEDKNAATHLIRYLIICIYKLHFHDIYIHRLLNNI